MAKIPKWLRLHDPGPPRLWRIGYALAACFIVALAGLALLWLAAQALLGHPHLVTSKGITVRDTVGVTQLVFASVAGAGALVALVVAYRRQRVAEDRTPVFNERFATIAAQLGDDKPAVRLAGVHAMAGLADDWTENRQTCVDVLCAYLRLPYDKDPIEGVTPGEKADRERHYRANREVRHTIIRLIGAHLRPSAAVSWQGLNLDFTGVVFDGGDFSGAVFSGGEVRFVGAVFSGDGVDFGDTKFSGAVVYFGGAVFSGGTVSFFRAVFSGGLVSFGDAKFSGGQVSFVAAKFSGGQVRFDGAKFSGGQVRFDGAEFSGGQVRFDGAEFSGGQVYFGVAVFSGAVVFFSDAEFSGGDVRFDRAKFSDGAVYFGGAKFSGGTVRFDGAEFSGGQVHFVDAKFSGGTIDLQNPSDWSRPPIFGWKDGTPPAGIMLPTDANAAPT